MPDDKQVTRVTPLRAGTDGFTAADVATISAAADQLHALLAQLVPMAAEAGDLLRNAEATLGRLGDAAFDDACRSLGVKRLQMTLLYIADAAERAAGGAGAVNEAWAL